MKSPRAMYGHGICIIKIGYKILKGNYIDTEVQGDDKQFKSIET
jgi:hypothetical protein